ncbi:MULTISPECIES: orotate phosphoribosyltransferase [unclassified Sporosarcina]|uniref:orotate phosphoribosyltransferase n=1 Tax=unclassified Sporosarcina TaxID=2647733 RepID=UPI000C16EFD8|nr:MULTISPECIES: orotate phosphoribosyltransferase [unclassified Sporosarcina]PIC86465.1 orotate phosphoribosyltransferase [Sporosarcina sp. P20a]PID00113.1 orotate phosphoribosyltransferase [Sporosarcina sp. P29]PID06795.1 orotate phosphoribosyltransferase [Sporosarcina sp. P30]PID09990.1 orotate phosphoribosyltransferase [Sporosarcina sp. P31]PID13569.1 orotate phosphoribosyltransferase [Sporosarcina sp. P32b]
MTREKEVAHILLNVGAVAINPEEPFIWASGIESPIYCDNRLTMADPVGRKEIAEGLAALIRVHYPETTVIAGTATAGIPHAAWVADILKLPMVYIRSTAKAHGKSRQIEGKIEPNAKAVIIEDLISTGGSSLNAANALIAEDVEVCGIVSIFTYELQKADEKFAEANLSYHSLTNFAALAEVAKEEGAVKEESMNELMEWHAKLKQGTL